MWCWSTDQEYYIIVAWAGLNLKANLCTKLIWDFLLRS
jgi:hypothetical protein